MKRMIGMMTSHDDCFYDSLKVASADPLMK